MKRVVFPPSDAAFFFSRWACTIPLGRPSWPASDAAGAGTDGVTKECRVWDL